jgi:hypothetical protein
MLQQVGGLGISRKRPGTAMHEHKIIVAQDFTCVSNGQLVSRNGI